MIDSYAVDIESQYHLGFVLRLSMIKILRLFWVVRYPSVGGVIFPSDRGCTTSTSPVVVNCIQPVKNGLSRLILPGCSKLYTASGFCRCQAHKVVVYWGLPVKKLPFLLKNMFDNGR